jgi:hypothetical protein
MANKKNQRPRREAVAPSAYDEARDELFQHIMRCGVTGAELEHVKEWFDDTMVYFTDRYPELTPAQLAELRTLGERFAQPPRVSPTPSSGAASAA